MASKHAPYTHVPYQYIGSIDSETRYRFADLRTLFGLNEGDIAGRLWVAGVIPRDEKKTASGEDIRNAMAAYAHRVVSLHAIRKKTGLKQSTFERFSGVKTAKGMIWAYLENIAVDGQASLYVLRDGATEEGFLHAVADMVAHAPFRMKDLARRVGVSREEMDAYFPIGIRDDYVTKRRSSNQYTLNDHVSMSDLEQVILGYRRGVAAAEREKKVGEQAIRRIFFLPFRYKEDKKYALKAEFHSLAYAIIEKTRYKDARRAMEHRMLDDILAIMASAISRDEAVEIRQVIAERYGLKPNEILDDTHLPKRKLLKKTKDVTKDVTLDYLSKRYCIPEDKLTSILQDDAQEAYLHAKEEGDGRVFVLNDAVSEADLVSAVFEAYEREATNAMLRSTRERALSKQRLTFRKSRFTKDALLHAKIEMYTHAWPYAMARLGYREMNKLENTMLDCVVKILFETLPPGKGLRIFARLENQYGVTLDYSFVRRDLLGNGAGQKKEQKQQPGAHDAPDAASSKRSIKLQVAAPVAKGAVHIAKEEGEEDTTDKDDGSLDDEDDLDEDYSDELASIDAVLGNDDEGNNDDKDSGGDNEDDEGEYADNLDNIKDPFNT